MEISIQRVWFTPQSTCGILSIDNLFQCYTLEPPVRTEKPCAMPAGTYDVIIKESPSFTQVFGEPFFTPHLQNVPGFSEIEIHPGNRPAETSGCLLVGNTHEADFVGESDMAFTALMAKLPKTCRISYVG
jgi:hypothetical protein